MADERPKGAGPGYYMGVGLFVVLVGLVMAAASGGNQLSDLALLLGAVVFVFGLLAKAVQIGTRSGRD